MVKTKASLKHDRASKTYDFFMFFSNLYLSKIRSAILKNISGKVIETGIGTGASLKYYPKNIHLIGIDFSEGMLSKAKQKARGLNLNCTLEVGDSERLSFKKNSFDYAYDSLCLCTYKNPLKVLKEMKRVCKKKGKIILIEHGLSSNKFIRFLQFKIRKKQICWNGCDPCRDPKKLFEAAGLKAELFERKLFGIFYIFVGR